jgi:hypothetical protein
MMSKKKCDATRLCYYWYTLYHITATTATTLLSLLLLLYATVMMLSCNEMTTTDFQWRILQCKVIHAMVTNENKKKIRLNRCYYVCYTSKQLLTTNTCSTFTTKLLLLHLYLLLLPVHVNVLLLLLLLLYCVSTITITVVIMVLLLLFMLINQ